MKLTSNRFLANAYPFACDIAPRLVDLDLYGHLNNAAIAAIYEEARARLHIQLFGTASVLQPGAICSVVAEVNIVYLQQGTYANLHAAAALLEVQRTSYVIALALFQNEQCIGLSDARMMRMASGQAHALEPEFAAGLSSVALRS
jgi:acyl-CoA thioester hydrolase